MSCLDEKKNGNFYDQRLQCRVRQGHSFNNSERCKPCVGGKEMSIEMKQMEKKCK